MSRYKLVRSVVTGLGPALAVLLLSACWAGKPTPGAGQRTPTACPSGGVATPGALPKKLTAVMADGVPASAVPAQTAALTLVVNAAAASQSQLLISGGQDDQVPLVDV